MDSGICSRKSFVLNSDEISENSQALQTGGLSCSVPTAFHMCSGPGTLRLGGPCTEQGLRSKAPECWVFPPAILVFSKSKWTLYRAALAGRKITLLCLGKGRKRTNIWAYFLCTGQDEGYFVFHFIFFLHSTSL